MCIIALFVIVFLRGQQKDGARLMLPTVSLCLSLFFFPKAKPPGIEYLQHSLVWLCFIPQCLVSINYRFFIFEDFKLGHNERATISIICFVFGVT